MIWFRSMLRPVCWIRGHMMCHTIEAGGRVDAEFLYFRCRICGLEADGIDADGQPVRNEIASQRFPYLIGCYGDCTPRRAAVWRAKNMQACDVCRPLLSQDHEGGRGVPPGDWRRITPWQALRVHASGFVHRIACRIAGKLWS